MEVSTQTEDFSESTDESDEESVSADVGDSTIMRVINRSPLMPVLNQSSLMQVLSESPLMPVLCEPILYTQEYRVVATVPANEGRVHTGQEQQECLISSSNSNDVEVDDEEAKKLFAVLVENNLTFKEFLGSPRSRTPGLPIRHYRPYPSHQQLYLRQQLEQERRRQHMSTTASRQFLSAGESNRILKPSAPTKFYCVDFRKKIVQGMMTYIGKYSSLPTATQNDCSDQCVICLANYQVNQMLRKLRCGHKFHRRCIDEWLVKKYVCPTCRCHICEDLQPGSRVTVEYFTGTLPSVTMPHSPSTCGSSSSNQQE